LNSLHHFLANLFKDRPGYWVPPDVARQIDAQRAILDGEKLDRERAEFAAIRDDLDRRNIHK
jgi:hypothetical protein